MARFSRGFLSARRVICRSRKIVLRKYLSNHLFTLMMILLFAGCGNGDLEDCIDAQMKLNEHNLINNSGVKWESEQKARRSYKAACANILGLNGAEKLDEN